LQWRRLAVFFVAWWAGARAGEFPPSGSGSQTANCAAKSSGAQASTGHSWRDFRLTLRCESPTVTYDRKGLHVEAAGGGFAATLRWRVQLRLATPFDSDPRRPSDFLDPQRFWGIRRARFKAQGHLFKPWLEFDYEHDLVDNWVYNAFVTVRKLEWLQFRMGQWKAEFGRERFISSGSSSPTAPS